MHLDQTNFIIRTKAQLQLLTTILLEGLGSNPFPIGLLYREWNFHKYGQVYFTEINFFILWNQWFVNSNTKID